MGSPEGFGRGSVVGEVRWGTEGACSSGGRKDDIHALNVSAPPFWRNPPVSEHCMEVSQPSSANDCYPGDINSRPLDIDVKLLVQKSSKIERKNGRCTKTSGVTHIESSKRKSGLHAVNGISPEVVASSSASRNTSEKNQLIKQKNSSAGRRGEKRNSKVKHKNRCDSFSLKNGLVGFSSAAGGNNFFGAYGLKPDVFDITKYVNEQPLHELLRGSDTSPCIAKDKGKKATSSNNVLLQSVRNMCSVLQAKKILNAQNSAEVDNSCIRRLSTGFTTVNSSVGQTDAKKGCSHTADLPSSNQVLKSDEKTKVSTVVEPPLFTPKEILERLALPPPKDLDLLLSDASKTTPSSKSNTDPRLGKQVLHRTGLPPFSWSHTFSGHSKLGSDTPKSSTSRTICQGRWVKVETSSALQNDLANLLVDFESLAFDQNLVPTTNLTCERANKFAPIERDLSTFVACSSSEVPAEECSSTQSAARTLLQMAAFSKENPCAMVKVSKKPSQITTTAGKSKAIKRSNFIDPPNSSIRPPSSSRVGDYGFSSKKPRLSSDATNGHTDAMRKGKSHQAPLPCFKSPPRKLSRDSNANTEENGTNLVKKQCVMKTPRSIDRPPGGTKPKLWKPSQ